MTWKRTSIIIFLLIVFLNIIQLNIFLLFVFNSQSQGEPNNGISSDLISTIWLGELILGLALLIIGVIYFIISKRSKIETQETNLEKKPRANLGIKVSAGLNHVSPFYRLEIENKGEMPVIDITLEAMVSDDSFQLDTKAINISLIRSQGIRNVKFQMKPKKGRSGKTKVGCRMRYYNVANDEYEEMQLETKTVAIKWPSFKRSEITKEDWMRIAKYPVSAEESLEDIPISGQDCVKLIKEIVENNDLFIVTSDTQKNPYKTNIRIYAQDLDELKYAAEVMITASGKGASPSKIKIKCYGENKKNLAGFFYTIYNEIAQVKKGEESKEEDQATPSAISDLSKIVMEGLGPEQQMYSEFDRLRRKVETIEKDKIGIDSKYKSLYELDELYKILAEDLVKRRIIDIKAGEEMVKKRLEKKHLDELKRFEEAYALLCEAETSDSVLMRKDFPDSGKKAILLVYFNAIEVYVRERLKELIPRGVTVLLGENHGHINTRKKDWEKSWAVLSLGSCIHIINRNKYLFLKNQQLWKQKVETLMHQVREMRNVVAHPSTENPEPQLVREKVYQLIELLPEVLKSNE